MQSLSKPTNEQVDATIPKLSSPQHELYFFSRLENPNWIEPLAERGVFKHPPPVEKRDDGSVRFDHWPASKYLARMAGHDPQAVANIFLSLSTQNPSILHDQLQSALKMPANIAATLVPKIIPTFDYGSPWLSIKDASQLCARLAQDNQADAAFTLASILFTVKDRKKRKSQDDYWYLHGLEIALPSLTKADAYRAITLICTGLKLAVEGREAVDQERGLDYSDIWRPAIEDHPQNANHHVPSPLVGIVRRTIEDAIKDRRITLPDALRELAKYKYQIFRRIEIHIINVFAEEDAAIARQKILDHNLFSDPRMKHEYAMLLAKRFGLLTREDRDQWYAWIEDGPNMEGFSEYVREFRGREATDADRTARIEFWQYQHLFPIRNFLAGKWKEFHDRMFAKHGEPEFFEFNSKSGTRWGHESPVTVEELKAKGGIANVLEFIRSWRPEPTKAVWEPNLEGLLSTFGQYIGASPEEHSREAQLLIGQPPHLVRTFIDQMEAAVREGKGIDALSVIELCQWVVAQPVNDPSKSEDFAGGRLIDAGWQWSRDSISRLIERVCDARTDNTPQYSIETFRKPIGELLQHLIRGSAASYVVGSKEEDDPRLWDFMLRAINSPRGKALDASLRYARWIANHVKVVDGNLEKIPGGMRAMPEFQTMLEWVVMPENSSFQTSALLGSHLSLLYWIDKEWLRQHVGVIFELATIEKDPSVAHGWAAWNGFLVWTQPHVEYYELLKEQFAYAVRNAKILEPRETGREEPLSRLAEHLIILYGRGDLGLDDGGAMLRDFLTSANPKLRNYAVEFAGRSVYGEEDLPSDVAKRLMELWEWYWPTIAKPQVDAKRDERLFGWWFSSGKFPDDWAFKQMLNVTALIPIVEPDHEVVERLATSAAKDPDAATEILGRMERGDANGDGWHFYGWQDSAKAILTIALSAGGTAREKAIKLLDRIGRRGFDSFGSLLQS